MKEEGGRGGGGGGGGEFRWLAGLAGRGTYYCTTFEIIRSLTWTWNERPSYLASHGQPNFPFIHFIQTLLAHHCFFLFVFVAVVAVVVRPFVSGVRGVMSYPVGLHAQSTWQIPTWRSFRTTPAKPSCAKLFLITTSALCTTDHACLTVFPQLLYGSVMFWSISSPNSSVDPNKDVRHTVTETDHVQMMSKRRNSTFNANSEWEHERDRFIDDANGKSTNDAPPLPNAQAVQQETALSSDRPKSTVQLFPRRESKESGLIPTCANRISFMCILERMLQGLKVCVLFRQGIV